MSVVLPEPRRPAGDYVMAVTDGHLVYVSGHAAYADGGYVIGTLGDDLTVEEGRRAARLAGLNALASLREEIGSLDRVRRVLKVFGMVRATPDFGDHPKVIDGCSVLLVQVFGERGRHARSAVGMASLPFGTCVEVEMTVSLRP